jgi:small nuclear ribonucleoprotein (snRNP)-like protein
MTFLDRFRPYPELKAVIVNLKSGTSFRGVVWRVKRPFMVVRNVEMLSQADKKTAVLRGEVVVLLEHVDFIQVT